MEKNRVNPAKGLNYGVVGNNTSAALISEKGSVDFFCLPFFDSSAVFAHLLDSGKGGEFAIEADDSYQIESFYRKNSNILVTRFVSDKGSFDLLDFMPRYMKGNKDYNPSELVRIIRLRDGKPGLSIRYNPRIGFGEGDTINKNRVHSIKSHSEIDPAESFFLYSNLSGDIILDSRKIEITEDLFFLLSYHEKIIIPDLSFVEYELQKTEEFWNNWADRSGLSGIYAEEIMRSSLALKMMIFQETGAVLAALTTGLPETAGEERNWDYRFCWIRDSSMMVRSLCRIGHIEEAEQFLVFVLGRMSLKKNRMRIMYGIHGEKELDEKSLDWLRGYKESRPVRVGNGACDQRQNDIYGVLLDLVYFVLSESGAEKNEKSGELWSLTCSLADIVADIWMKPDMGIWEFRGQKQNFVYSKVMCWVALDRSARIADMLGKDDFQMEWRAEAARIKADVLEYGWKTDLGAFTQSYENDFLDAANLLMGFYGFIDPSDSRYRDTVLNSEKELCRDGLMFRYKNADDFGDPKSSFTVCSFWLVQALVLIGEKEKARAYFDQLIKEGNHLGLFSEDLDFNTREMLGNFPQGYSHMALIDSALMLEGKY